MAATAAGVEPQDPVFATKKLLGKYKVTELPLPQVLAGRLFDVVNENVALVDAVFAMRLAQSIVMLTPVTLPAAGILPVMPQFLAS